MVVSLFLMDFRWEQTPKKLRHKSVTLLRSPGVQHPLILALEIEKLSFLKACLLISAKNYFLLDFHRELANYRKIQISPLTNLHQFFFFFNFLFQFWHIFGQASKENVGSTYISLLNPNYWGLLDGLASSFWSSNISENFGIWRRKSVTPCWSKKNYFSGKIDGKP